MVENRTPQTFIERAKAKGRDALGFLQDLADSGANFSRATLRVLTPLVLVGALAGCAGEGGGTASEGFGSTINVPAGVNRRDSEGGEGMDGPWYGRIVGSGPATLYDAHTRTGAPADGNGDGSVSMTWWCGELANDGPKACVSADALP